MADKREYLEIDRSTEQLVRPMSANVAAGAIWPGLYHDGHGLRHRPPTGVKATPRYTEAERAHLLKITDQADALATKLRARAVRTSEYDARLIRVAGKAHARLLRRIWIGGQPYLQG